MDPPSFTKKILKEQLQIKGEYDLEIDQMTHTIEQTAKVIDQKLEDNERKGGKAAKEEVKND